LKSGQDESRKTYKILFVKLSENMSAELPHNWQNDLMNEIEDVERQLEDALERIGTIQRVKDDYDRALKSARKAKADISHFIGVLNDESR
jgi:hypothetical protein